MSTTIPIPKIYWDTFQAALQAQVKRLAKDVAKSLRQPEQPLLKAILTEKVDAYLFEEEGAEFTDLETMRCKYKIPSEKNGAVLEACREPVLLGKGACCLHLGAKEPSIAGLKVYRTLKIEDTTYWLDGDTVLNDELECCGVFKDNKCTLFKSAQ
jgi:hypothetical protein